MDPSRVYSERDQGHKWKVLHASHLCGRGIELMARGEVDWGNQDNTSSEAILDLNFIA